MAEAEEALLVFIKRDHSLEFNSPDEARFVFKLIFFTRVLGQSFTAIKALAPRKSRFFCFLRTVVNFPSSTDCFIIHVAYPHQVLCSLDGYNCSTEPAFVSCDMAGAPPAEPAQAVQGKTH